MLLSSRITALVESSDTKVIHPEGQSVTMFELPAGPLLLLLASSTYTTTTSTDSPSTLPKSTTSPALFVPRITYYSSSTY
jgi:hypothetical protein